MSALKLSIIIPVYNVEKYEEDKNVSFKIKYNRTRI